MTMYIMICAFVLCLRCFAEAGYENVHCTLVDCPGHAGLIRTIIGGAQIIDLVCYEIDACYGVRVKRGSAAVVSCADGSGD